MDIQCDEEQRAPAQEDDPRVRATERARPVIDQTHFRLAMSAFATGITLATTASGWEWHGATANAVMSVSLEPPMVLLSIQTDTRMHRALQGSDNFALNMLSVAQQDVAAYFADSSVSHGRDAFIPLPHHVAVTGAPLLEGSLASVDCRIVERYPAGDHLLYLGQVVHLEIGDPAEPLLYFRGRFR